MERDLRLILAIQALRAFAYGFGSVILGTALANSGLREGEVGLVFAAMLAGMALVSLGVGMRGERIGRRKLYLYLLLAMGISGAVFAMTTVVPLLVLFALTGTLSTDANESGPITSLEQAMLGQAPSDVRTRVFGKYNAVAYLAGSLGALAAGGPDTFRSVVPAMPSDQRWLMLIPLVAALSAMIAARLSSEVEADGEATPPAKPLNRSKATVSGLAKLFSLDSFAGGFIVQAFLVYWFHARFDTNVRLMAVVFFVAGLLQAGSSILSGRLAHRFGMLNTMVFSHLPSNVLLIMVPLTPTLGLAIAVLLLRFALSQMDVPARQAYVVAMVDPEERTAAAAYTNTARYVTRPFGPLGAAALMQIAIGAPFVVAGGLKIAYDLLIYKKFRKLPVPEEG